MGLSQKDFMPQFGAGPTLGAWHTNERVGERASLRWPQLAAVPSPGIKNSAGVWIPSGRLPCVVHMDVCKKLEQRWNAMDAMDATVVPCVYCNAYGGWP